MADTDAGLRPNIFATLAPADAQRLNHEGWVLKLAEAVERPSSAPRRYFVIGRWENCRTLRKAAAGHGKVE